jgi:hypothetical protein
MSLSKFVCQLLSKEDYALWDKRVDEAEGGTVFHQSSWLGSFGRGFDVIGCFDNGNLTGGMPISYQQVSGLKIGRPPYLTPYLGPVTFQSDGKYHRKLALEKEVATALTNFVTDFCDFIRIPLSPNSLDVQPFQQSGFEVVINYTYLLHLDNLDHVWKGLNQDRRRKVRKGYEEGLRCELSDDLGIFFPLWKSSLSEHEIMPKTGIFDEIKEWYASLRGKNQAELLLVKDSERRVCAGAILVWDKKRAYYLLSGMDREISRYNTATLLLWECMRFCSEEIQVKNFDFDGSDVPSVEFFFRGFGGCLTPRFTVIWGRNYIKPIRLVWRLLSKIG